MAKDKQPMDPIKKVKLVYTIELLVFAAIFLTLGILFITGVIPVNEWKRIAFPYVTMIGGLWMIASFIWVLASPAKRKKSSLLDKVILVPLALSLLTFDIIAFANNLVHLPSGAETHIAFRYVMGSAFLYLTFAYLVQAIYHWKYPIPMLLEAIGANSQEEENKE